MRKLMSFFFIWITLALVQIAAYEHCNTANTPSIENTDTCILHEYTYIVSLKDLLFNHQGMFVHLDDMFFSVSELEMIGNQWFATVDFGENGGYSYCPLKNDYSLPECPLGHPSQHNDGRCNQRNCPHFRGG